MNFAVVGSETTVVRMRLLGLIVVAGLIGLAAMPLASADSGDDSSLLCSLSASAQAQTNVLPGRLGIAVVDVASGASWVSDDDELFTLHSVSKAVLAFAAVMRLGDLDLELSREQRALLFQMVVMGENWAAQRVVTWLGGTRAMQEFYLRIRAESMVAGVHQTSWGLGTGRVIDVARMFAAVTNSHELRPDQRAQIYDLMASTWSAVRWPDAVRPALPGWRLAAKTGWFIPEWPHRHRVNQGSILFNPSGEARYAIAVMYEGPTMRPEVIPIIFAVQRSLAADLALREQGELYGDPRCHAAGRWMTRLQTEIGSIEPTSVAGPAVSGTGSREGRLLHLVSGW